MSTRATVKIEAHEICGADGENMRVLLASPSAKPRGVVIFCHPATGSCDTFRKDLGELADADWLALALEAPFCRLPPTFLRGLAHPENERTLLLLGARNARLALDFVETTTGRATQRGVLVGRNYGVTVGGILAATEPRLGTFVLQGGIPSLTEFWRTSSHPVAARARATVSKGQLSRYIETLRDLDASAHAAQLAAKRTLMQFGTHDDWITAADVAMHFGPYLPEEQIKWYDDNHDMTSAAVRTDYQRMLDL